MRIEHEKLDTSWIGVGDLVETSLGYYYMIVEDYNGAYYCLDVITNRIEAKDCGSIEESLRETLSDVEYVTRVVKSEDVVVRI